MWRVIWFFSAYLGCPSREQARNGACSDWQRRVSRFISAQSRTTLPLRSGFCGGMRRVQRSRFAWVAATVQFSSAAASLLCSTGCGSGPCFLFCWQPLLRQQFLCRSLFFYEVEGNEAVPSAQILRELQELGVGFGTYGPSIKPQELKNQMLLRIPKLQWLTVQQSGMCARVVVRERPDKEPVLDRKAPTDVIAARAGVLTRVEAVAGNCLCVPGQAVASGELLVSAYTDFGFKTQVTAARAEIYAETVRQAVCIVPETEQVKERRAAPRYAVSLLVGRRRISLFCAAVPERSYEKETKTQYFTLPGGFSLPLGIAITRICEYDTREEKLRAQDAEDRLLELVQADTLRDMIAGTITGCSVRTERSGGCIRLHASLRCEEMIARMRPASLKEAIE